MYYCFSKHNIAPDDFAKKTSFAKKLIGWFVEYEIFLNHKAQEKQRKELENMNGRG